MHFTNTKKRTCRTDCHNFRLNENSLTFLIVKSFVLYGNERRMNERKKNPIIFHAISFILTTFLLCCISKYISSQCTSSDYIILSRRHCCYRLSNINPTFSPFYVLFCLSFTVHSVI